MSNVDGLVSGMDTTTVINQLMQVEKQPQVRLQTKKTAVEKAVTAFQDLNTRFAALRDAAAAISTPSAWALVKGTSSAPDSVSVAVGANASTGSITFSVEALAAAASRVSSGSASSPSAIVATGPISITKGGVTTSIDTGDGTLTSVVAAINASASGVKAAAVQVATGSYRLQLTSATTGAASSFTVDETNLTGIGTLGSLVTGADAVITVGGASPSAYTVTSATNTVSDLLPGVTLSLKKASPGTPITLDMTADVEGLATKVQSFVDAANAALSAARAASATGTNGTGAGPLAGDSVVRSLEQAVTQSLTGLVRADGTGSPALAGVQTTRQGTITFDRATFTTAYNNDPAAVARVFQADGSASTADIKLVSGSPKTVAGTYGVNVTAAASRATVTGGVVAGGTLAGNETITITSAGKTATYNALAGASLTDVATGLNGAFAAQGLGLVATVDSGALVVRTSSYGATATFDVTAAGSGAGQTGLALGSYSGTDVQGNFTLADGTVVAATGRGRQLSAGVTTSPLFGMVVEVTGSPVGGTVTYEPGLARRLEAVSTRAIESGTGSLQLAIEGRKSEATTLADSIASWDTRLALREAALRKQFSAMEVALGRLRNQSSWLSGQISQLSG